jgi:hypothetical protein
VGETEEEPLVPLLPLQPLEAVQEVALVEDQLRVALCPAVMLAGLAESVAVGAGVGLLTVIVTESGSEEPPGPEQTTV